MAPPDLRYYNPSNPAERRRGPTPPGWPNDRRKVVTSQQYWESCYVPYKRDRLKKILMWIWNIFVVFMLLTACTTRDIIMTRDNERVNCGARFYGTSPAIASRIVEQEAFCVRDFKEQGFVRRP